MEIDKVEGAAVRARYVLAAMLRRLIVSHVCARGGEGDARARTSPLATVPLRLLPPRR